MVGGDPLGCPERVPVGLGIGQRAALYPGCAGCGLGAGGWFLPWQSEAGVQLSSTVGKTWMEAILEGGGSLCSAVLPPDTKDRPVPRLTKAPPMRSLAITSHHILGGSVPVLLG